ncbi:hypothetical protein BRYFOR_06877 [Marvinbryantia formatexigens DSM 14469]|uniref:DUF1284 domain-containing protein n=1 Tax=Marvinbryantia formatexigens DSM 14469 TaxID=478749 RepID=C6LE28_9FIRM|nr:DUF1284 domain-containing protein [Marvinbryantia formatexigens]EET61232.1 hypothetical protein BRYFOR_06877 [Marvinbryantia formatexigens DSM 14469]UWO23781.1 DUF1284 domain-containing protein [Marvinbryantia formatexigens DSM 14469]SDF70642.1 hypothetical protein SAMN05660368_01179 [Marvinbryantia formatexigens]
MECSLRLRIHHLLCIPLFVGYGYSDGFCRNMENMIGMLEAHQDEPLNAVCAPDIICAGCPNLTAENTCRTSGMQVEKKDAALAEALGIEQGQVYTYRRLKKLAAQKLTEEIFTGSCKNCQWYAKGLCSFEKWKIFSDINAGKSE